VIGAWLLLAVNVKNVVAHFDLIAWNSDDAFDVIKVGIFRKFKNDNVAAFRTRPVRKFDVGKWNLETVRKFISEQPIAHLNGRFHRRGWYVIRRSHGPPDGEYADNKNDQRKNVLAAKKTGALRGADPRLIQSRRLAFLGLPWSRGLGHITS